MEKLDGKSLDLVKTNIEALKQLFPEVVTEGKIDFEKLKLVLGEEIEKRNERYEFTWHGKTQAMKLAQTPSTGTLRPDKASSKNWDTTENLYIEGDNLEVLKLLQKSYFGKIKMIYIDPPYNTGKDFVYKDDFRDNIKNYKEMTEQTTRANTETNGRFHTDWLNMMYPRLKLARNLLADEGLIFVSIDDNEVYNLRALLNEVFGEDNFLRELVWQRHAGGGNDSKYFAVDHEYILVYAKNINSIKKLRVPLSDEDKKEYTGKDEYLDTLGPFKTKDFRRMRPDDPRPNLRYTIIAPDGTELYDEWKWEESKFIEKYKENKVQIRKGKNGKWIVEYKIYLNEGEEGEEREKVPRSLLIDIERNSEGKRQLTNTFNQANIFNNPKPIGLIKFLLSIGDRDGLILDFFSGSATTAHAVMQLNAEDGGNRKFIMVQLPEKTDEKSEAYKAGYKNICEIGKERIRRAGEKIVQETGKIDLDIGFKVFKLDSSNVKLWDPDFANLEQTLFDLQDNIKEDRTKEDLLYEILLKIGLPLTTPIEEIDYKGKTIYNVGFGSVLLCLENEIDLDIVNEMMKHKSEHMTPKVIFKESGFINDSVKTNAIQTLKKNGITDVRSV
ncbi:adenine-specific DNA-methyltransferase [Anoxybacillus vitaminiphilus]|uniref:Adenine-specific DNA-methyltransferase n=1 Tax=Paranoxybacillus vitaminiphilus TaxID=581036 RepID=A0A327Y6V7_9BACL|nr:site-specific DNA-methyltransferase [Anoxybacillus vitaminiphilus]RAK14179.1 adenine-specific DNA-methyltransferase [Anoxybacillus vitaminiphilus]